MADPSTLYFAQWFDPANTDVVLLDVPGAAVPVYVTGVHTGQTRLFIGQREGRVYPFSGGKIPVPWVGGGFTSVKWTENVPGYPVAKSGRVEIFRLPKPAFVDRFVIVATRILPFVFGILPGWFIGLALARWVAGMVKQDQHPLMRRLLPLFISFCFAAIGVAVTVAYFATEGFTQS